MPPEPRRTGAGLKLLNFNGVPGKTFDLECRGVAKVRGDGLRGEKGRTDQRVD